MFQLGFKRAPDASEKLVQNLTVFLRCRWYSSQTNKIFYSSFVCLCLLVEFTINSWREGLALQSMNSGCVVSPDRTLFSWELMTNLDRQSRESKKITTAVCLWGKLHKPCDIYQQVYPSCLPLSLTQVYYNSFAVRVQRKRTILAHVFVIIFLCFMSGERELKPTTKNN